MISVEDAKFHLRVEHADEDAYIAALVAAAHDYITRITTIAPGDGYPPTLRQAGLLLVGAWYANREAVADGSTVEVPLGFRMLIAANRPGSSLV